MTAADGGPKAQVRAGVLSARRALGPAARERAARRITDLLLDLPEVADARRIAAYLSFGTEPSTAELL